MNIFQLFFIMRFLYRTMIHIFAVIGFVASLQLAFGILFDWYTVVGLSLAIHLFKYLLFKLVDIMATPLPPMPKEPK